MVRDGEIITLHRGITHVAAGRVVERGGNTGAGIGSFNADSPAVVLKRFFPAAEVIEDVSAFRIILRLEVLVDEQAAATLHEQSFFRVVGGGAGSGELVPGIAFFRVRVVVTRRGERRSESLRVERDSGVLAVGVGRTVWIVKRGAGEIAKVR